jgi:hypothetical protein
MGGVGGQLVGSIHGSLSFDSLEQCRHQQTQRDALYGTQGPEHTERLERGLWGGKSIKRSF